MMENCSDNQIIKNFIDNAEAFIAQLPPVNVGLKHVFEPGVYIRKVYLPKGAVLTSKVHNSQHHFIVSKGKILVYDGVHETVILEASFDGTTMPGTRRIVIALEDTVWMTVHPTKIKPKNDTEEAVLEAVAKIESKVIIPYKNLKLEK